MTFAYDTGTNGKDRRASLTDLAGSETYAYDALGRSTAVTRVTDGVAYTTQTTYTTFGGRSFFRFLVSHARRLNHGHTLRCLGTGTDPPARPVRFTYDPAGRVLTQTLPDLRVIERTYDANGNVASITPPSRPARTFDYTPIDLEARYTPPDLGIGYVATTYTCNADRQLTLVTRPDGQTLTLDYVTTSGRLPTLTEIHGQTCPAPVGGRLSPTTRSAGR